HVGKLNYDWVNTQNQKRYTTEVKVIDPLVALNQQFQYFDQEYPKFQGIKILLAQVPAYKARLIAAATASQGYQFNLIISQAETEEATPTLTESVKTPPTLKPSQNPDMPAASWVAHTFVAVPAPFYDAELQHKLTLQVRRAVLERITPKCADGNSTCLER